MKISKKNGSKWIAPLRRNLIYLRDNHTCQYCGKAGTTGKNGTLSLDHIDSFSTRIWRGREIQNHSSNNLITSCRSCNSSKGEKSLFDFTPKAMSILIQARPV